jgi:hypothetical protein
MWDYHMTASGTLVKWSWSQVMELFLGLQTGPQVVGLLQGCVPVFSKQLSSVLGFTEVPPYLGEEETVLLYKNKGD